MAHQYDGMQSILNAALGDYHGQGFRLEEFGDDFLSLYYHDEHVGMFSPYGATIPVLHEACREHLESLSAS